MSLTPEERESVAGELKRFGTELNLSEDQKQKLHNFMSEAYEKLQDIRVQISCLTAFPTSKTLGKTQL